MTDPFRKSPMLGGTLLCLGAVLMVICGYFYFDDVIDKPAAILRMRILAGLGYFLWLLGSVQIARARFSPAWAGLLCGFFLVPGLFVLIWLVPTLNRQQIWQNANPDFGPGAQRRQYRNLKSLH